MLEIIIDQKHCLQTPADIAISFVEENPLFLTDRIPAPYSLSFEIPNTLENLKAFGFPNRLTSKSVIKSAPAQIRHQGMIFARGQMLLLEITDSLKLQFTGSRDPFDLKVKMDKIPLAEYNRGQFPHNPATLDYRMPMLDIYTQSNVQIAHTGKPYVIAPVKKLNTEWWGREDRSGAVNTFMQYINYFNPQSDDFTVDDSSNINIQKFRTPIFPFPYLYKVIDAVFGNSLENNPFASGDLKKLVILSVNHPNGNIETLKDFLISMPTERKFPVFYPLIDSYEENASGYVDITFTLNSFMQQYFFNEFLKEILKIFCMTAYPGAKFRIEYSNDVMNRTNQVCWDEKLAGDTVISYEPAKAYIFKYSKIEKASEDDPVTALPNLKAIYDEAMNNTEDEQPITYKDESTGAKYSINRTLQGIDSLVMLKSQVKQSPLATHVPENDLSKFEVISEVCPANMNIHDYWTAEVNATIPMPRRFWLVPEIDNTSFEDPPYIMFWAGLVPTLDDSKAAYPCLMAHHTDHFGTKRLNTSLHPDGPEGLIEKFHMQMKQWVEKEKVKVKAAFLLSVFELYKLDIRDKISLQGKLFYIEKLSYTINNDGVSLIDADLIEI